MRHRFFILFAALISFLCRAGAPPALAEEPPVAVSADSATHDPATNVLTATGNVRLSGKDVTLSADSARLSVEEGKAHAEGNVRFERDGDVLTGDSIDLDLDSRTGRVTDATLFVKRGNVHASGSVIEKLGETEYRVRKGTFTTCEGGRPAWKIRAGELKVEKEFAVGKNAVFYISEVPVLYTPYIAYPVARERQSGFLIPRLGSSTKKGVYLEIPYYLNIAPSRDATVFLDVQTKRAVGAGLEYRYLRRGGSDGTLRGYGFRDFDENRFRGSITARAREFISDSSSFATSLNLASDRDFLRDYGEEPGDYNRKYLDTVAFFTYHPSGAALTGGARYTQDLRAEEQGETLQELPFVLGTLFPRRVSGPFAISAATDIHNFHRDHGLHGQRLSFHPLLSMHSNFGSPLDFRAWGGYDFRAYNMDEADEAQREGTFSDGRGEAGLAVSATLSRVYTGTGGRLEKLRHVVLPELSLVWEEGSEDQRLPFLDFSDTTPRRFLLRASVSTHLTGRFRSGEATEYRELASLFLSGGRLLSGTDRDLLTLRETRRPFTDLRGEARLRPSEEVTVSADAVLDPYSSSFRSAGGTVGYLSKKENMFSLGYRMLMPGGLAGDEGDVPVRPGERTEYVEGKLGVALVKPFVFLYTGRYSPDRGDFLEALYSVEYRHQCWGVTLQYRDRTKTPLREGVQEFFVTFTLGGVGSLGKIKAF